MEHVAGLLIVDIVEGVTRIPGGNQQYLNAMNEMTFEMRK